jgi:hypothetical protein
LMFTILVLVSHTTTQAQTSCSCSGCPSSKSVAAGKEYSHHTWKRRPTQQFEFLLFHDLFS